MANIIVGHYEEESNWECFVEPDTKKWILFVDKQGNPVLYPKRDKKGGVIGKPLGRREQ